MVINLGSNIGNSVLYFMTRNDEWRCYLFEADSRNVEKLNLSGHERRYVLRQEVVSDTGGSFRFGIESTGRYGGIGLETRQYIEVNCLPVNEALREMGAKEGTIDAEGVDLRMAGAIEEELLKTEHIPREQFRGAVAPGLVRAAPVRQRLSAHEQDPVPPARTTNWLQQ